MINNEGEILIKSFEGFKTKAYLCPAGVWTIGWGSTRIFGGKVQPNQIISVADAQQQFEIDLWQFEGVVGREVKVPLTENQRAALVSLCYNIGPANFTSSTLLRKLNAGDYAGAAEQFDRWNKAGGKALAGLTRRREAEKRLFLKP